MADDIEKTSQLVKAKTSSLQKRDSNIISRGLSDLALLDVEKRKITDEEEGSAQPSFEQKRLSRTNGWFEKGWEYYQNKEYDKAIKAYTNAIALAPNYALVYRGRGLAYDEKGQYDRVIEDSNKTIALDPNHAGDYYNRGNAYEMLGNIEMAIADYRKACDLGLKVGCENLKRVLRQK
jgi:tetratricopeptide (TPR) repeat protein